MLAAMDDPSGDLSAEPRRAAELVRLAHQRLLGTASRLDDAQTRRASLLPEWSIGHVLTHLARNADGHSRRFAAALRGADEPRYPGGAQQRCDEIDEGAGRPAAQILCDLQEYVAWDLPQLLATVPRRWGSLSSQRRLLAWLAGRADPQDAPQLDAWG